MSEIWDLYNEKRELTGRDHVRGEKVPAGFYHLVVHVWIRNSRGEYLISRRSADRPVFPLLWECVGGSALKGENSLQAAVRETKEELGLDLIPGEGKQIYSIVGRVIDGVRYDDIVDAWLFEYNGPVSLDQATTREVAQTRWMNKAQTRALFDSGQMVPTLEYFFDLEDQEEAQAIAIEEIPPEQIQEFWDLHIRYLVEDGFIDDEEDIEYFSGREYRDILESHMLRSPDKQHMVWFLREGQRIGAASFCTYQSEGGKCFILDFWVFPPFRGHGTGHRCFDALEEYTKADGAKYYELNSTKEESVRFWKSLGFTENGKDEWDMSLYVRWGPKETSQSR